jgi:hypothetical protein
MVQNLIIVLPGLAALIVCIRRGPEQALLDIYLPTLLLLPQSFRWTLSGELCFAETAILPIGLFFLFRSQREWQWSVIDLLVISYIAIMAIAEGINAGYKNGQNVVLREFIATFLPYFAIKQTIGRQEFVAEFAKRIVVLLTIAAIVTVYEFRMGSDLFLWSFRGIFPTRESMLYRGGFTRAEGPYGSCIWAGMVMAIGYRIARWLDWSGAWPGLMPLLPISKIRFCELWIIAGIIMAISIGPWLGFAGGAIALSVCLAPSRKHASALLVFAILLVGLPVYSAFKSYISAANRTWSVAGDSDSEKLQEDGAYRGKLLDVYIPVIEERPAWGWGRMMFPVMKDMSSIDNGYLLMALSTGLYALGLFVVMLVWIPIRLCALGLKLPRGDPTAMTAFTLMGVYLVIAINLASTSLDSGANEQLFFLVTGWSAILLKLGTIEMARVEAVAPQLHRQLSFRRVMV